MLTNGMRTTPLCPIYSRGAAPPAASCRTTRHHRLQQIHSRTGRHADRPFQRSRTVLAASSSGGSSSRGNSSGGSRDPRAALWEALFQLGAAQAQSLAGQAAGAAADAAVKLQRYIQPPPPAFPPGPAGDQSVALLTEPLAFLDSLKRQHGGVAGFLLGGERVIVVSDPAAARQVLIQQPDVFVKEGTAFFPGSSLTGNGLLVSDGPVWQRQRRLANPAFRQAAVDKYAAEMVVCTQRLLAGKFAQGGVQDVYAAYNELTLDITLAALFGMSSSTPANSSTPSNDDDSNSSSSRSSSSTQSLTRSQQDNARAIVSAVEKAFAYFTNRGAAAIAVPEWVPTPDNLEFQEAVQQLDRVVYDIIAQRRAANLSQQQQQQQQQQGCDVVSTMPIADSTTEGRQQLPAVTTSSSSSTTSSGCPMSHAEDSSRTTTTTSSSSGGGGRGRPSDLLQSLLDATDDSGQGMTDTALRDELMTLLVAGQETSAILLGWATALLAAHPETQAAAAAEVDEVLGGATPSAVDIGRLLQVLGVVLEALRCYPPAYLVGRCANAPVTLVGRYQLPAGTTVLVSPYLLHKDPTRWHQPSVFKPSRWLPFLLPEQEQQPTPSQQQQQQQAQTQLDAAGAGNPGGAPTNSSGNAAGNHSSSSSSSSVPTAAATCPAGASAATATTSSSRSGSSGSKTANFMAVLRELGPNGAYVPFGGGPRNCIGTGFAMMEAVLVLAALLQQYEVQPVHGSRPVMPRPKPLLTLRPDSVPVRIVPRQQAARPGTAAADAAGASTDRPKQLQLTST